MQHNFLTTFVTFFFLDAEHFKSLYWICYNIVLFYALILAPRPGIKPALPALEGEVLTPG